MGKGIWLLALGLLLPVAALAENKPLTLDVGGEIGIDHSGAVYDFTINTIMTPEVKQVVDRAVRQWKFEPVMRDGKPVFAKSRVHLTLNAIPVPNGYRLQIDSVRFSGSRSTRKTVPPRYPTDAVRAGIGASVLVAVRVDREGKVVDAVAAQSFLISVRGSNRNQEMWRKRFESVSVDAAKDWKFQPADLSVGDEPDATVLVPITFSTGDFSASSPGWRTDRAGPQHPIPWLAADRQQYDASGLREGESIALSNPVRLKVAVEGKTL